MKILLVFSLFLLTHSSLAQLVNDMDNESKLYAESKQIKQFFIRCHGEEDEKGKWCYTGDKLLRTAKLRKKYLGILLDKSNSGIASVLKTQFVKEVLDKPESTILDFHGAGWFSEVHTTFIVDGKAQPVILFMELEKDHLGTKWVINKVHADIFEPYFLRDTTKIGRFLHPMSHELDFMNLTKALANSDSVSQFTVKRFVPDHLSLFLYEIKKGNMRFQSVNEVKFHFFQINGWYFELSEFNRPGYNTGWLMSGLVKLNNDTEKDLIRKHLYYDTQ